MPLALFGRKQVDGKSQGAYWTNVWPPGDYRANRVCRPAFDYCRHPSADEPQAEVPQLP